MRVVATLLLCSAGVLQAAPVMAQSEQQLRQAFEGQHVVVRMDMPATQLGIDLYPDRDPTIDFRAYSARLREHGIALREGTRVMVTTVRVKKKNIEFQLGGGGYGVFGDDSGSVYVPTVSKSNREKDLEKQVKSETDAARRRSLQRELDELRRDREREERDRDMERMALEERKKSEIADKRINAGSRVNIWLPEARLANSIPTPGELQRMLAQAIDFSPMDSRRVEPPPPPRPTATPSPERQTPNSLVSNARGSGGDIRRGMSTDEVHDLLGTPTRSKPGKQGELSTLTEWYEEGDRVTEVVYVGGVVVKFSTSSK